MGGLDRLACLVFGHSYLLSSAYFITIQQLLYKLGLAYLRRLSEGQKIYEFAIEFS
jgi:hypothetical protein